MRRRRTARDKRRRLALEADELERDEARPPAHKASPPTARIANGGEPLDDGEAAIARERARNDVADERRRRP